MISQQSLAAQRAGTGTPRHIAAPYGGLNTRDPQALLGPLDAIQLVNLFPDNGQLYLRGGSSVTATISPATPIRSLHCWFGPSSSKLFAATSAGIYDITAGGTTNTIAAVLTNGDWRSTNITNSAGSAFLWGCNGADAPFHYNGTVWANPAISGVGLTVANLNFPWIFKRRLWAIEKNSMNAWYLDVDSIAGVFTKFPFGSLFKNGGSLVAAANWSRDSGDGLDDYMVVITSKGEVAVYQGTDPTSTTSWSLVGVYFVGIPVSARCFEKIGGDLVIWTESGGYPLSVALETASINPKAALTAKIRPTLAAAYSSNNALYGWSTQLIPQRNALWLNVPTLSLSTSRQYVMNTITGAWTSFTGLDALCSVNYLNDTYIGRADGTVWKIWQNNVIFSDNNADISALCQTSFNYFQTGGSLSQVGLFRPLIFTDGDVELAWGLSEDFRVPTLTGRQARNTSSVNGGNWDTSSWDLTDWASYGLRKNFWKHAACRPGFGISLLLQMITKNANVAWAGTDYILQRGGVLG